MLKPIESLLEPDPRYQEAVYRDATGLMRSMQIGDLQQLVQPIELGSAVPLEVRHQFDLARLAFVYSWFAYELATLAELHAYGVLELALKCKAKAQNALPKQRGLAILIKLAIKREWLRDHDFEVPWPSPSGKVSLLDLLPHLRNELAHGSTQLFPQGSLESLGLCAAVIGKLFPETLPVSTDIP